jgi:hypothetical protein
MLERLADGLACVAVLSCILLAWPKLRSPAGRAAADGSPRQGSQLAPQEERRGAAQINESGWF